MNQHKFLIATTIFSSWACILTVIAFTTKHWLEATAVLTERLQSNVSYGLFTGSIERQQLAATLTFTLTLVCDVASNACMYSCQKDSDHRHDELKRVLHAQDLDPCEQKPKANQVKYHKDTDNSHKATKLPNTDYIAASMYICSVIFLSLAFIFSLMSLMCSVINLKWHPVERIFNIFGLYIWNAIAVVCYFLSLALWSALFGSQLQHNIAITDTLRQQLKFTSEGYASLGYSYYLVIVSIVLHIINLILLFVRRCSIAKQPHQVPNNMTINDTDARLEFY